MSTLASVVLYLLALDAVACATLAWGHPGPLELVGWALGLGVIQLLGETLVHKSVVGGIQIERTLVVTH